MRNVTTEKLEKAKAGVPKPYGKPTLVKGPVLAKVTSQTVTGALPSDEADV